MKYLKSPTNKNKVLIIKKEDIINVLNNFKKTYEQEVPKYSAVKINGKKLYEYARKNINIKLPKRSVTIYDIKLLEHNKNKIKFYVKVSKGTYIRALARDIGEALNSGAHLTALERTRIGDVSLSDCISMEQFEELLKQEPKPGKGC